VKFSLSVGKKQQEMHLKWLTVGSSISLKDSCLLKKESSRMQMSFSAGNFKVHTKTTI
jgi:hypothetical protein